MPVDSFRDYLREIGRFPLLKAHEEIELGNAIQLWLKHPNPPQEIIDSGRKAKTKLIRCNLRLVVAIAKKYRAASIPIQDLIQEGAIGLDTASERFDPSKGYKFSTYAYWWIRQAITRAIATSSRTIRLPCHVNEKLNKIRKLGFQKGGFLTSKEIATELGISEQSATEILQFSAPLRSLDCSLRKDGEAYSLGDRIASETDIYEQAESEERLELADRFLSLLPDGDRKIIELRYGLGQSTPKSTKEVATVMGITGERVRQRMSRAIAILRAAAQKEQRANPQRLRISSQSI